MVFIVSLSGFGIKVTLASQKFGSVPSLSVLWISLKSICISSSLNVW
jgi:hypothetical protein